MTPEFNKLLLSRYIISRHIASGGMADVYEAQDIVKNKTVALKFLKDKSLYNDFEIEQFKDEARFLAAFNHPHIMKIYNVGEYNGVPFQSFELIKGKTFTLKAAAVSKGGKNKIHRKICFESSNTDIATVSSKGKIKAKKAGVCYIFAYAQDGTYKSIKVSVKNGS